MAKKTAGVRTVQVRELKPLLDSINKALKVMKNTDHAAIVELREHFEEFRMDCHRAKVFKVDDV